MPQYRTTIRADWGRLSSLAFQSWRLLTNTPPNLPRPPHGPTPIPSPAKNEIRGCRAGFGLLGLKPSRELHEWPWLAAPPKRGVLSPPRHHAAAATSRRISNISAGVLLKPLPGDLSDCWSRKWIFYSSLAWSITYKPSPYFVVGQRERETL